MSGQEEYKERASEKMNKAVELLDKYEESIGLPKHSPPGLEVELNEYFTWDRNVIESMSIEQCASTAYRLSQFAFYFQREVNREEARKKWAESQLSDTIAKEMGSYDKYMKHDLKVSIICKENSYANILNSIIKKAEGRIIRLNFLSSGIRNLSDVMISVQRSKFKKHE